MATNYPGSLDSFPARADGQSIFATHVQNLQDAVTAVETELGTNPKASSGSVAARIAAAETRMPMAVPTYSFPGTAAVSTDDGPCWYNRTGKTITISAWDISATTAPAGANIIADVLKNGTTTFTTTGNRPTLLASSSQTHATSSAPDITTVASGDYLQVKLVQVGSSTAGANVTLTPIYS